MLDFRGYVEQGQESGVSGELVHHHQRGRIYCSVLPHDLLPQNQTPAGNVNGWKQRNFQALNFQAAREGFLQGLNNAITRAIGDRASAE